MAFFKQSRFGAITRGCKGYPKKIVSLLNGAQAGGCVPSLSSYLACKSCSTPPGHTLCIKEVIRHVSLVTQTTFLVLF